MTANISDENEHRVIIVSVVAMILPRPTSGETIPPNRNPVAPKIAEAAPTYERPSSMASVVAAVKI